MKHPMRFTTLPPWLIALVVVQGAAQITGGSVAGPIVNNATRAIEFGGAGRAHGLLAQPFDSPLALSLSSLDEARGDPEVLEGSTGERFAQGRPVADNAALETIQIRPNFFVIFGAGSNVAVHIGAEGVILVDSGSAAMASKLLEAVKAITDQPIRLSSTPARTPTMSAATKPLPALACRSAPTHSVTSNRPRCSRMKMCCFA